MRLLMIVAATSLAAATAGCKERPDSTELNASNGLNEVGGVTQSAGEPAAALGNADFANAIAGGGRFEIESADLAATKATSAVIPRAALPSRASALAIAPMSEAIHAPAIATARPLIVAKRGGVTSATVSAR